MYIDIHTYIYAMKNYPAPHKMIYVLKYEPSIFLSNSDPEESFGLKTSPAYQKSMGLHPRCRQHLTNAPPKVSHFLSWRLPLRTLKVFLIWAPEHGVVGTIS